MELDGLPSLIMPPPAVTLTFDLWPQNLNSTSMNPHTSVAKIGWNFLHWVLRVHKVFETHRLTDLLTDGQTRKQNASDTESFLGGGSLKILQHSTRRIASTALRHW